jgi:hypothetical protein
LSAKDRAQYKLQLVEWNKGAPEREEEERQLHEAALAAKQKV